MKYYCLMHKADYSESDIMDMIIPTNIEHHYSPQTYWEPGEDYISCDYELNNDFNKVVQIAKFYYYDKDEPFAVIIDSNMYYLGEKEDWQDILKSFGWVFFEDRFDMEDNEYIVKCDFEDWIDVVANNKAWEYVENEQYGDY